MKKKFYYVPFYSNDLSSWTLLKFEAVKAERIVLSKHTLFKVENEKDTFGFGYWEASNIEELRERKLI
jgi:hypothetical protein